MYHFHIHFYLLGAGSFRDIMTEIAPPEQFTYSFSYGIQIDLQLLSQADVTIVQLDGMDAAETSARLMNGKKDGAHLIFLAQETQIGELSACNGTTVDIWRTPLSEEEFRFRFDKWQQAYKLEKDLLYTNHLLESAGGVLPGSVRSGDNAKKPKKEGLFRLCDCDEALCTSLDREEIACRLFEKNRTLEKLFCTMDCGILFHRKNEKSVRKINQAALHLLGYESADELPSDIYELIECIVYDEDRPRLIGCIKKLEKPGDSVDVEYRIHHKDGKLLHVLDSVKLIQEGGALLYQHLLLDCTAQRNEEAEKDRKLEYQEQIFGLFSKFLADNIGDIYIMLDAEERKPVFCSTNIDRILGIQYEELQENLRLLVPLRYTSGRDVTWEDLDKLRPGMSLPPVETERIHHKTGEHRWFHESVYCVAIQEKKKFILYISDRTQERKIQDTLSEALQMAEAANKAKSTFLGNVSHDIRTPMNAIIGFIPLLREEADNPEHVLEYTQKISAASQHLLGLISSVLDMDKIEAGSMALNICELNMSDLIDDLNTIIRPQAQEREQTFEISIDSLPCEHLLGDKLRINQILLNILSNAVKYTQKGGTITMQVRELPQIDQNHCRLQFVITDNGQGMSEEYQHVLFEPFTREMSTTINQVQGTGLGMAITKRLVDMMNGSISVESELGKGTTFTVELELRVQEKEADHEFWEKHGIRRIIVADDDEDICHDIMQKMSGTGVTVDFVTHGARAVGQIRKNRKKGIPYDLILLDWKMPDLSGLETARLIRQNYKDNTPIFLFTAYDWSETKEAAQKVGIDHFLPKPFFMTNFMDTIQRFSEKKSPASIRDEANPFEGKHILVVDDIDVNRMVLTKILTVLGAQCDTAENGQEAVDKFTASAPDEYDLIIMDIQMPIMNGHDATRAIRSSDHPSAQKVAIVALTANAFVDDIRDSLNAGMDAHLSKPVVLDQLKKTIHTVFESKKASCSIEAAP